jgi:hypothetical protein
MDNTFQSDLLTRTQRNLIPLARGMRWGLLGGLAGTMVMDAILMGALSAVRQQSTRSRKTKYNDFRIGGEDE